MATTNLQKNSGLKSTKHSLGMWPLTPLSQMPLFSKRSAALIKGSVTPNGWLNLELPSPHKLLKSAVICPNVYAHWCFDLLVTLHCRYFPQVEPEEPRESGEGCSSMEQDGEPPEKQSKIKQEASQPPSQSSSTQQHYQPSSAQDTHYSQPPQSTSAPQQSQASQQPTSES